MSTELKIMLCGVLVLGGFLWSYLFLRQFLYNILVAFPVIKKMNALQPDLIAIGATRYTYVSCVVCVLLGGVLLFLVIYFLPLYLIISFAVGAFVAFLLLIPRMKPSNKEMFDLFSNAYARFIPDDELRNLVYYKEYKKIRSRLRIMGLTDTFVPEFKK